MGERKHDRAPVESSDSLPDNAHVLPYGAWTMYLCDRCGGATVCNGATDAHSARFAAGHTDCNPCRAMIDARKYAAGLARRRGK